MEFQHLIVCPDHVLQVSFRPVVFKFAKIHLFLISQHGIKKGRLNNKAFTGLKLLRFIVFNL